MVFDNQFYTLLVCHRRPGMKYTSNREKKLFAKVNKSVLSHITFYLEDDDHKPVGFDNEIVRFTCQLN